MSMRVYISGKIGEEVISEAARQKFAKAEEMLKAKGHEVVNVTSEIYQADLKEYLTNRENQVLKAMPEHRFDRYSEILLWCLNELQYCDAVYFLRDWDKSNGANTEHSFAMATGKKLLWERLEDAQVFHGDDEKPEDVWLPIAGKEGGV